MNPPPPPSPIRTSSPAASWRMPSTARLELRTGKISLLIDAGGAAPGRPPTANRRPHTVVFLATRPLNPPADAHIASLEAEEALERAAGRIDVVTVRQSEHGDGKQGAGATSISRSPACSASEPHGHGHLEPGLLHHRARQRPPRKAAHPPPPMRRSDYLLSQMFGRLVSPAASRSSCSSAWAGSPSASCTARCCSSSPPASWAPLSFWRPSACSSLSRVRTVEMLRGWAQHGHAADVAALRRLLLVRALPRPPATGHPRPPLDRAHRRFARHHQRRAIGISGGRHAARPSSPPGEFASFLVALRVLPGALTGGGVGQRLNLQL